MSLSFKQTRYELSRLRKLLEIAEMSSRLLQEKYVILNTELTRVKNEIKKNSLEINHAAINAYGVVNKAEGRVGHDSFTRAALSSKKFDDIIVEWKNVRGVIIPVLIYEGEVFATEERGYYLQDSDAILDEAYVTMRKMSTSLAKHAQLVSHLKILQREVKKVELRYRALDRVLIPMLRKEGSKTSFRIDELEREEASRVKLIKEEMRGADV